MLEWIDRFNHRRQLEPIGDVPPTETEASFYVANTDHKPGRTHTPTALR